jgi:hypothetical protein
MLFYSEEIIGGKLLPYQSIRFFVPLLCMCKGFARENYFTSKKSQTNYRLRKMLEVEFTYSWGMMARFGLW